MRKLEEQEAQEEIKLYENSTNEGGTDRQHGLRPVRRQRGSRKLP
jgi:hypothetical protein